MSTHLDDIKWNTWLWNQRVLVKPRSGRQWLTERLPAQLGHIHYPTFIDIFGDVALHVDSEATAFHRGDENATVKDLVQVDWVITFQDSALKKEQKLASCFVDGVAMADSDILGHVPRKLPKSADKALIGTLGTVLREGRL